ncbi:unnamed protein product [Litomosoides sigmodontis]|uniref:Uncharacterized protein n=1 Tax=Litomosoides sigmodontis TaxID=42156 RepID=A0A3P6TNW1_LITSI|nr:unnamed protein product [Litomosoides sigmodontis]
MIEVRSGDLSVTGAIVMSLSSLSSHHHPCYRDKEEGEEKEKVRHWGGCNICSATALFLRLTASGGWPVVLLQHPTDPLRLFFFA